MGRKIVVNLLGGLLLLFGQVSSLNAQDWTESEEGLALIERVDQILERVASFRGLSAHHEVKAGLMMRDELEHILLEKLAEEYSDLEIEGEAKTLVRLGLLDERVDYKAFVLALLGEQIAGFYDDDTKSLYVMEGQDPATLDSVMSHELFHAIQDQQYGIDGLREGGEENTDLMTARTALIEGDAVAVMIDFELAPASFTDIPNLVGVMRASLSLVEGEQGELFAKAPLVIREGLVFPYVDGLAFIAEVKSQGGWSAVDALYLDPPSSTEQVLHPERYFERDDPQRVAFELPPELDVARILYEDVTGELGIFLYFKQHVLELGGDLGLAARASEGWDGDLTYTVELQDERVVYLQISVWDSEQDAIEFAEGMEQILEMRFPESIAGEEDGLWIGQRGDELNLIERRGTEVLYIEGLDLACDAETISDSIWLSM